MRLGRQAGAVASRSDMATTIAAAPERTVDRVPARHGWSWWGLRGLLVVTWCVGVSWLQLARIGGSARAWNSLWAEDGGVFLTNAYQRSLVGNLFRPHAGYYQVICRLLAQPAAHLPVAWAAPWMAWSAAGVVAICSLIVWDRAGQVTRHRVAQVAIAVLVPLLPQAVFEVSGVVADLQWYLIYTLFWVLIVPPKSLKGCVLAGLFAALVGLSDPLAGLMLAAAAVGWWRSGRGWRPVVAPACLGVALVAQLIVHSATQTSSVDLAALPDIYVLRVLTSGLVGDHLLLALYPALGTAFKVVASLLVVGAVGYLFRGARTSAWSLPAIALLLSLAYLAITFGTRGTAGVLSRSPFTLNGSRYTVIPLWLLFAAVILLADANVRNHKQIWRVPVVLAVVCVWIGAETLSDWSNVTVRSAAPDWSTQVRSATASCRKPIPVRYRTQPTLYEGPVTSGDVVIPIAPLGPQPIFGVIVSCNRLLAGPG
jgi:hypothetical protein